jgi:phosphatidylglycerol lysyltransferase
VIGLLYRARRRFTRRAALFVLSWRWLLQVGLVLGCAAFVGLIAYRHVDYSRELWWQFAFDAGASRMLRASVVCALALSSFTLWALLHPHRPPAQPVSARDLERADACLARSDNSLGQLALLGDKQLLFSDRDEGLLMYRGSGKCLVALGDPIGPASAQSELAWRYRELCDECGMLCVFYKVREETLPLYLDLGLSLAKLGEEAHVCLKDFELTGHDRAGLRTAYRKVTQGQLSFSVLEPAQVSARMPELESVSQAWLARKQAGEKGFSVGSFLPAYVARFPCAVIEQAGRIVAFANVLTTSGHEELAVDLMRFTHDAPSGVMDGLLVNLMLWGRACGYQRFNLGMAPLSGLHERPLSPLWHKAGIALHAYGQSYYNFEGLRRYKEKFRPLWRPRYLASPGGIALPRVLFDTTTLIAGGIKAIVSK